MALLDKQNEFSDAQAITVTADSTNTIDKLADGDALAGAELYLVISVNTSFTAVGAGTLQFQLLTDDDVAFGSPRTLWDSGAIGKATLVAGYYVARVKLPVGMQRYTKLVYTVATGPMTAGKVDAYLTQVAQVA